jgi:guanine deaminase
MDSTDFMRRAIALSEEGLHSCRGGPFGAVIVKGDVLIAAGSRPC